MFSYKAYIMILLFLNIINFCIVVNYIMYFIIFSSFERRYYAVPTISRDS